jgi:hypothetical protein
MIDATGLARKSSLSGNILHADKEDIFEFPDLVIQYRDLVKLNCAESTGPGNGLLLFGSEAIRFSLSTPDCLDIPIDEEMSDPLCGEWVEGDKACPLALDLKKWNSLHTVSAFPADNVWCSGGTGLNYYYDGSNWRFFGGKESAIKWLSALFNSIGQNEGIESPAHGQPHLRVFTGGSSPWVAEDQPYLRSDTFFSGKGWVAGLSVQRSLAWNGIGWDEYLDGSDSLHTVSTIDHLNSWIVGRDYYPHHLE